MISSDATVQSRSLPDGTWSLQWVHGAPSWLFSSTWLFLTQNWWWLLTRNRWETSNHQFVAAVKTVILAGTWCTCLSKRHFLLTLAPDLCVCGSFESLHFLENIKVWHLIVITILIDQGQFFRMDDMDDIVSLRRLQLCQQLCQCHAGTCSHQLERGWCPVSQRPQPQHPIHPVVPRAT